MLDDTYHNVVTTTYTACSCGSTGTSSVSTVKEAHTFGEAKEVSAGNWQKTCTGCGATRKAEAPAQPGPSETTPPEKEPEETKPQETTPPVTTPTEPVPGETVPPETHVHEFLYGNSEAEHPHYSFGYCSCGVGNTKTNDQDICCQCSGNHIWGYPVRLPDGSFKQTCTTCEETQTTTPGANVELYYRVVDTITHRHNAAKVYQDVHDIDSSASAIWKTIAEQATDKLAEEGLFGVNGFVWSTEMLNGLSDQMGTIVDAAFMDEETWNEQQTEMWEILLIEMLQGTSAIKEDADAELAVIDEHGELAESFLTVFENLSGGCIEELEAKSKGIRDKIYGVKRKYNKKDKFEMDEIKAEISIRKQLTTVFKELNNLTTTLGVVTDGTRAKQVVDHQNQILLDIKQNVEYRTILDDIYKSAYASGNTNLANAVLNLYDELDRNIESSLLQWWDGMTAFTTGMADSIVKEGAEEGIEIVMEKGAEAAAKAIDKWTDGKFSAGSGGYLGILEVIELGAKVTKWLVKWDDSYQAAQQLMTINQMDATMNITQVLKNQDNPYMAELWGLLQTEGCEQAKVFLDTLDEREQGNGLSAKEFGIKKGTLSAVNQQLDIESKFYVNMLGLSVDTAE